MLPKTSWRLVLLPAGFLLWAGIFRQSPPLFYLNIALALSFALVVAFVIHEILVPVAEIQGSSLVLRHRGFIAHRVPLAAISKVITRTLLDKPIELVLELSGGEQLHYSLVRLPDPSATEVATFVSSRVAT